MSQFESGIKQIPYPQESVYEMLSDLTNLERVKDRLPQDKVSDFRFDRDTVSMTVSPVGNLTFAIVEREAPKCIKFQSTTSPVPLTVWIQLLPVTERSCKLKLTVKAELNLMLRGMVQKPLQEGVEKMADMLAAIQYEA